MRLSRFLPVLGVGALVVATITPAAAQETGGVGTTTGLLRVVDLDAGELLTLDLLGDFGTANTDPDVGEDKGFAALDALKVTSPAAGVDQQIPLVSVESTGEEQTASQEVGLVSNPVISGSLLPIDLSALVGSDGAASTIGASLANLNVLGGVLGIDTTQLGLESNAGSTQADGSRGLQLDAVNAVDLDELLTGLLGIGLGDLPTDMVLGLLEGTGLLPQLTAALATLGIDIDLENLTLEGLQGAVDDVVTALTDLGSDLCLEGNEGPLGDLGTLIGLEDPCEDITAAVDALDADEVLADVLDTAVGLLEGAPLLSIEGLEVGVVTLATSTVEDSVADVTATIGGITVGSLEIPEVDVLTAAQQIQGQLDTILGTISDDLTGIIDIGLLEETTDVTEDGDTVTSTATFDAVRVDIGDLTDAVLNGVLGELDALESVNEVLAGLTLAEVPELPVADISQLNTLLGEAAEAAGPIGALSDGLALRIGSIGQESVFTEVLNSTATPQTPAQPQLPNTGSNDTVWLLAAALAAAGALGVRRIVRSTDR